MLAAELTTALSAASPDFADIRRRLGPLDGDQLEELRMELIRRLATGELPPVTALAVLPWLGVEAVVPELVPLLRTEGAPVPVRAAALLLLREHTTWDVERDFVTLAPATIPDLVEEAIRLHGAVQLALQKGTPFERLALMDPEDYDDADREEILDELLAAFCESPEAAAVEESVELPFWTGQLVDLGMSYGHGSPVFWNEGNIEELLSEILPRKVSIRHADDTRGVVPAFRMFFRWASRVAFVPYAKEIDEELERLEADFPAMMTDSRRFGPAKSFVMQGTAAGFDMSTEEGLREYQELHNSRLAATPAGSRRKADQAKKRKAKMAKLSRRKNRRK